MTRQASGTQWIYDVNVRDFESRVLDASAEHPVLVDFWAEWCAPCLVIAPVLAQRVGEYGGARELAKVEVDAGENMKLAGRDRVRGFPTVMLFRQGEEQGRFSGAQPVYRVRDFIRQHSGI